LKLKNAAISQKSNLVYAIIEWHVIAVSNVTQGLKTGRLLLLRYWARGPNRREGFSSLQFFNSAGVCEFAICC